MMRATASPPGRQSAGLLAALAAVLLALAPAPSPAHDAHAHHAKAAPAGYTRAAARYEVPDVHLLDASGARVALRSELDPSKPVLLNFIFTSCTAVCPVMSATMSEVQAVLGKERRPVRIVSISIDPEHDTPARLKEYAARHRAGADWHLLTGDRQTILQVARAFDAWRGDKMNHVPATYLRAGAGQPWLRLDGFATPGELVHEYHSAVGKASKG
jgi:protein SCO1/2